MRTPAFLMALLLTTACAGVANASCVTRSAPTHTQLLALYTSEGCSSCPPADRWLRGIRASAAVVPLEFHVDYWDSLGWPDRFDDHRFTVRQQHLAARSPRHITYTPEVALDGHEWRHWYNGRMLHASKAADTHLILHVTSGRPLHARLETQAGNGVDTSAWRVYFAVTENGLSSQVKAGENSGALLHHDHTVRAFAGPLPLDHASATLKLPAHLKPSRSSVVAFVQDTSNGDVKQVVREPLLQCKYREMSDQYVPGRSSGIAARFTPVRHVPAL